MGQNKPGQGCDENHGADGGRQQESGQFGLQVPISTDKIGDDLGPTNVPSQANEFSVNFVIITHVKSQTITQIGCQGTFELALNILSCNGNCYAVKYENNKILLKEIMDACIENGESRGTEAFPPTNPPTTLAPQAGLLNIKH